MKNDNKSRPILNNKQHFYKQRKVETGKNQANAKQHPVAEL